MARFQRLDSFNQKACPGNDRDRKTSVEDVVVQASQFGVPLHPLAKGCVMPGGLTRRIVQLQDL